MSGHICCAVQKNCYNPYDSYGEICVGCGCCGKPSPERDKARLALWERRHEEDVNFDNWCDNPKLRALQEKNRKLNIIFTGRRLRYYRRKVKQLPVPAGEEKQI